MGFKCLILHILLNQIAAFVFSNFSLVYAEHITMYFYRSVPQKIVALAKLRISSLRMVQVDRNMYQQT